MADGEGFKHIALNAPDDDEVIVAGVAAEEGAAGSASPAAAAGAASQPASAAVPDAGNAPDATPAAAERAAEQPAKEGAPQPASGRKDAADRYAETTLEDLESEPRPLAQRIVIIAAVLLIIAALVYSFVVMRENLGQLQTGRACRPGLVRSSDDAKAETSESR